MQEAIISITAVASDQEKHQKLNFFANGKTSNLEKVGNVQLTRTDMGSDFLFSLSENMECLIEQSNTVVTVEKELKRLHKKFPGLSQKEKIDGFINCVKGTYDFIYGVSGENEIEFSKDKLFTGLIITDGRLTAISTNYNSIYLIRKGTVKSLFVKSDKPVFLEEKERDENYSPAADVIKEYTSDEVMPGDMFIFATTNANTKIDSESITNMMNKDFDAEETSWRTVEKIRMHGVTDNYIVMVLRVDATRDTDNIPSVVKVTESKIESVSEMQIDDSDEKQQDDDISNDKNNEKTESKGIFSAAASIFKNRKEKIVTEDKSLDEEESTDDEYYSKETEISENIVPKNDKIYNDEKLSNEEESDSYKTKLSFPGLSGEFKKVNKKRPAFMKRRMNIYLKRFVSIIIVLLLMAGIVYGMIKLLNLIFTEGSEEIIVSVPPTVSVTPTPTPTPTTTPTETPAPSPTAAPEPAYIEYTVQSGDTLSKISALFYDGDSNHVAEIVAFNENITDPSLIRVGQVIKIPTLYTQVPGE